MKRQDLQKYQQMTVADLVAEIKKLEAKLVEFNIKKSLAQIKNVRDGKLMRHDIARLRTIIRTKELV